MSNNTTSLTKLQRELAEARERAERLEAEVAKTLQTIDELQAEIRRQREELRLEREGKAHG